MLRRGMFFNVTVANVKKIGVVLPNLKCYFNFVELLIKTMYNRILSQELQRLKGIFNGILIGNEHEIAAINELQPLLKT